MWISAEALTRTNGLIDWLRRPSKAPTFRLSPVHDAPGVWIDTPRTPPRSIEREKRIRVSHENPSATDPELRRVRLGREFPREPFGIFHGGLDALGENPLRRNVYICRRAQ